MTREAIEVYIETLVAHSDPIPGPAEIDASHRHRGQSRVT